MPVRRDMRRSASAMILLGLEPVAESTVRLTSVSNAVLRQKKAARVGLRSLTRVCMA